MFPCLLPSCLCPLYAASFPLADLSLSDEEEGEAAGDPPAASAAGLRACLAAQAKHVARLEGVVAGQAQRVSQVGWELPWQRPGSPHCGSGGCAACPGGLPPSRRVPAALPTRSLPCCSDGMQLEAELAGLKRLIVGSGSPLLAPGSALALTPASQCYWDADSGAPAVACSSLACLRSLVVSAGRRNDPAVHLRPPAPPATPLRAVAGESPLTAPRASAAGLPPRGSAARPGSAAKRVAAGPPASLESKLSAAAGGGDENAAGFGADVTNASRAPGSTSASPKKAGGAGSFAKKAAAAAKAAPFLAG